MKIANFSNKLSKDGLPKKWQLYTLLHALFTISIIFMSNDFLLNISNILATSLISIGLIAGYRYHRHNAYPWGFFIGGIVLVSISIILHSLLFFGIKTNPIIITGIEELGIILVSVFTFTFMLLFEKKYKLNGFTIDFSLIVISLVFFIFLISPNLLNTFLYKISVIQQLALINLFVGVLALSMTLLNHILCKEILLKDVVRIITIVLLICHFLLETIISFKLIEAHPMLLRLSWSFYHLGGSFSIAFLFLEHLSIDYHQKTSTLMSSKFMWSASILAILVIPIGVIIRDRLDLLPISAIIIGVSSFALSSIVIIRFQILIKNADQQRKNLSTLAYTDSLTGLLNDHGCRNELSNINNNTNMFVLSINVEDFKSINDLHGREFGDAVLKSLAARLETLPSIVMAVRIGADNFQAFFRTPLKDVPKLVDDIQEYLGVWDMVENRRIAVPLTYGASHSTKHINLETITSQSEQALKVSRAQHTCFTLYSESKKKRLMPRHELRELLQKAVDDNHLPVHFQPIYDLKDGSLKALELLIRLESEEHGLLLPRQFLEQAKSYGLLTPLTQVCINMVAKCFQQLPDVTININVPPYMLNSPQILNDFIACFEKRKLPIHRFCVEVTEDGDIPTDHLIPSIKLLRSHGFKIAMDDFGTGYSSLSRLSVLPVDVVKIDRSLLLSASSGDKTILESAISLTKRLGASAVVEGVETLEQLSLIKKLGADSVQGFLLSKPVKISKVGFISLNAADIVTEF